MSTQALIVIAIVVIIALVIIIVVKSKRKSHSGVTKISALNSDEHKSNQVYIGNLAYGITDADLRNSFEVYGNIAELRIVKNNRTGRSKGFAFITYKNQNEANKALASHGQNLQGRRLVVRIAKPRID